MVAVLTGLTFAILVKTQLFAEKVIVYIYNPGLLSLSLE